MHYLDFNATTPMDEEVAAAMVAAWREGPANASSQHRAGRLARGLLEAQLEDVGRYLGADVDRLHPDHVLWTSGGTEANNLALFGMAGESPGRVIVSSLEHPSVLACAARLAELGWQVDLIRALGTGVVDLDHLRDLLATEPRPEWVAVAMANHETGVLQPVEQVVALADRYGVPVHTDAVQMIGKLPVDFRRLGVATLSVSAHKLHGPCGIGALLVRSGRKLTPRLFGGSQQQGMRPGTEPVALAVGLATALRRWSQQVEERAARMRQARDLLQQSLVEAGGIVNGSSKRLPNTLNISFPGVDRQALLMALDLAGVCCSAGSACASGSSEPSSVLRAMGLPAWRLRGAVRISVAHTTGRWEAEQSAALILGTLNDLRG